MNLPWQKRPRPGKRFAPRPALASACLCLLFGGVCQFFPNHKTTGCPSAFPMVRTSTQADMSTCNPQNSTFCPYTHWHKTVLCVAYAKMIYLSFSSGSHSQQSIITATVAMFGNNMGKPVLPSTRLLNHPTPRLLAASE